MGDTVTMVSLHRMSRGGCVALWGRGREFGRGDCEANARISSLLRTPSTRERFPEQLMAERRWEGLGNGRANWRGFLARCSGRTRRCWRSSSAPASCGRCMLNRARMNGSCRGARGRGSSANWGNSGFNRGMDNLWDHWNKGVSSPLTTTERTRRTALGY